MRRSVCLNTCAFFNHAFSYYGCNITTYLLLNAAPQTHNFYPHCGWCLLSFYSHPWNIEGKKEIFYIIPCFLEKYYYKRCDRSISCTNFHFIALFIKFGNEIPKIQTNKFYSLFISRQMRDLPKHMIQMNMIRG